MDLQIVSDLVWKALDSAQVDIPDGLKITFELGAPTAKAVAAKPTAETEAILKRNIPVFKTSEERIVIGVVLEPTKEMDKPDSQGDIYSAAEVQKAAYKFMEEFQVIGLQHQSNVSDKVKVLLNWVTLEDTTINGQEVKAGTWLMGVRVADDQLWEGVKKGDITGFSIGGFATSTPVS